MKNRIEPTHYYTVLTFSRRPHEEKCKTCDVPTDERRDVAPLSGKCTYEYAICTRRKQTEIEREKKTIICKKKKKHGQFGFNDHRGGDVFQINSKGIKQRTHRIRSITSPL